MNRRHDEADLERLQRILFYRELGFGLDDIRNVMTDGDAEASAHLRRQQAMLLDRIRRLERMAAAVEYEKIAPGLAQFLHDAITANAGRLAGA